MSVSELVLEDLGEGERTIAKMILEAVGLKGVQNSWIVPNELKDHPLVDENLPAYVRRRIEREKMREKGISRLPITKIHKSYLQTLFYRLESSNHIELKMEEDPIGFKIGKFYIGFKPRRVFRHDLTKKGKAAIGKDFSWFVYM